VIELHFVFIYFSHCVQVATAVALSMFKGNDQSNAVGVPLYYGFVEAVVLAIFCLYAWKVCLCCDIFEFIYLLVTADFCKMNKIAHRLVGLSHQHLPLKSWVMNMYRENHVVLCVVCIDLRYDSAKSPLPSPPPFFFELEESNIIHVVVVVVVGKVELNALRVVIASDYQPRRTTNENEREDDAASSVEATSLPGAAP
jgi:hypothetical protein